MVTLGSVKQEKNFSLTDSISVAVLLHHINLLRAQARRPLPWHSASASPLGPLGVAAVWMRPKSHSSPHFTEE